MKKIGSSVRFFLLLLSVGIIAGTTALTQEKAGPKRDYTLVENWPALPEGMKLGGISAVATDSKGQVYLLHRKKPFVIVLDQKGKLVRTWDADFKTPHGLRIDASDTLWIADMDNHLVQKFAPDGKLLLSLGTKDKPGLAGDRFDRPADANTGPDGEIYVADGYGNSRIAKFTKDGKFVQDWGKEGKGPSEFNIPHGVCIDGDKRIIVADRENKRVQVFDRNGKLQAEWKGTGAPYGLAVHKDRVFLADGRKGTIRVLDKTGKLLSRWEAGVGKDMPHWIHVDGAGAVYVGFAAGSKVQKWVVK